MSSAKSEPQRPTSAYLRISTLSGASRRSSLATSAAFDHMPIRRNCSSTARFLARSGRSDRARSFFLYSASSALDGSFRRRIASKLSVLISRIVTSVGRSGNRRLARYSPKPASRNSPASAEMRSHRRLSEESAPFTSSVSRLPASAGRLIHCSLKSAASMVSPQLGETSCSSPVQAGLAFDDPPRTPIFPIIC